MNGTALLVFALLGIAAMSLAITIEAIVLALLSHQWWTTARMSEKLKEQLRSLKNEMPGGIIDRSDEELWQEEQRKMNA